jgi:predicted DNA-binding transcriptional regulator AlpA
MTQTKKSAGQPVACQNAPTHFASDSGKPSSLIQRLIRVADIATTPTSKGMLPVSPATIWRWVREGKFPAPYKLGDSITVWNLVEVEAFIARRAGGAQQ